MSLLTNYLYKVIYLNLFSDDRVLGMTCDGCNPCGLRSDGVESKLGVANIDIVVDPNVGLPPLELKRDRIKIVFIIELDKVDVIFVV